MKESPLLQARNESDQRKMLESAGGQKLIKGLATAAGCRRSLKSFLFSRGKTYFSAAMRRQTSSTLARLLNALMRK